MDYGHLILPSIWWLNVGLIAMFFLIARHYRKHAVQLRLAPKFMMRWPVLRAAYYATARVYALSILSALRSSGKSHEQAYHITSEIYRADGLNLDALLMNEKVSSAALSTSKELGTYDQELQYQADASSHVFQAQLNKLQSNCWSVIQVSVVVLIAALIFSIYLPSFKMGAVV